MTDNSKDLPRDLRALCGGFEVDQDGCRALFDPVNAYAHVVAARRELEEMIVDPETPVEEIASLLRELEFVKREESNVKQRIVNHFTPRDPRHGTNASHPFPKVDPGAKSKVMKLMEDIEAGTYHLRRDTKTLKAVREAMAFFWKNKRMPCHAELMSLGFNDQQSTDAGKWLSMQADKPRHEDSLFLPLENRNEERSPKK